MQRSLLVERINNAKDQNFGALALAIFNYQAQHNPVYAQFLQLLNVKQADVRQLSDIPFLPIELFKTYDLQTGNWTADRVFTSSGTTGKQTSRHLLRDPQAYRQNARRTFEQYYGPLSTWVVLALLPAYLERTGSSLLFMAEDFIHQSDTERGGFFLYDHDELLARIEAVEAQNARLPTAQRQRILLLGVSFALLDLAERQVRLPASVTVMETGGMKGRRREITRQELHQRLEKAFGLPQIHSEYGMTELLSQAYAVGHQFRPAPTMRVLAREVTDPGRILPHGKAGALNIIDLANLDTISFIATQDLGRVYADGSFEVLGRLDASDVRGCNLLVG
ncbi:MAG: acyl transferase [Bacteroidota bacterium]